MVCILNICKDASGHLPKVVGIDIVELALWAKVCTRVTSHHVYVETFMPLTVSFVCITFVLQHCAFTNFVGTYVESF